MKARSLVVIAIGALLGCAGLWFALVMSRPPREPVYQGQPLKFWTIELVNRGEFDLRPQERAAQAIRAIGPATVPFLVQWLPRPYPRESWLERTLSDIPIVEGLVPVWRERREAPVPSAAIVAAFQVLGPEARSALPSLAKVLGKLPFSMRNDDTWETAAEAIPWIGPEAVPVMLTAVTNLQGIHDRWMLIEQFGVLGSNGVPAIPALIAWSRDQDSWVRLGAVNALGAIGQQPEVVIPVLRAALTDQEALVRRDAARALGSFGSVVIPDLVKALKDPDWQVRTGALGGLGKVALEKPDIVLPLLEQGLHDENDIIRRSAAYALFCSRSKAAFNILMAATNDPEIGDMVYQCRSSRDRGDLR